MSFFYNAICYLGSFVPGLHCNNGICIIVRGCVQFLAAGRGMQQHGSVHRKYDALPHAAKFLQKELRHVLVPYLRAMNVETGKLSTGAAPNLARNVTACNCPVRFTMRSDATQLFM